MSDNGLTRIANNEAAIREHLSGLGIQSMSDIVELPFDSIEQARRAHESREVEIGAEYNPENLNKFGFKGEVLIHNLLTAVPLLVGIGAVILGFTRSHVYYWGILFTLIGFFGSGPTNRNSGFLGGVGIMAVFGLAMAGNWPWVVIVGSMVVSVTAVSIAKGMYVEFIKSKALHSEILFCYMFLTNRITLRYTTSKEYIKPPR